MPEISVNSILYRNQDHEFEKILKGKTSERKIRVDVIFSETANGFSLEVTDEENISAKMEFPAEKTPANNPERANQTIENQLSKLGNTIYELGDLEIKTSSAWFIPASQLNEWRRVMIEALDELRAKSYQTRKRKPIKENVEFPAKRLTYLGNITNQKAKEFYEFLGVEEVQPGFEVKAEESVPLMFCKYCIKHALGWCPKEGYKATFKEPLFLQHNEQKFRLEFDCKKCEMRVLKA